MKQNDSSSGSYKELEDVDIHSCSAMDCTGLIPALPEDDAQLEYYQELYPYLPGEEK